jgi:aconitate hydratase
VESLGIQGNEAFDIEGLSSIRPQQDVTLVVRDNAGSRREIDLLCRIDTAIEIDYYQHGGILPYVLRDLMKA